MAKQIRSFLDRKFQSKFGEQRAFDIKPSSKRQEALDLSKAAQSNERSDHVIDLREPQNQQKTSQGFYEVLPGTSIEPSLEWPNEPIEFGQFSERIKEIVTGVAASIVGAALAVKNGILDWFNQPQYHRQRRIAQVTLLSLFALTLIVLFAVYALYKLNPVNEPQNPVPTSSSESSNSGGGQPSNQSAAANKTTSQGSPETLNPSPSYPAGSPTPSTQQGGGGSYSPSSQLPSAPLPTGGYGSGGGGVSSGGGTSSGGGSTTPAPTPSGGGGGGGGGGSIIPDISVPTLPEVTLPPAPNPGDVTKSLPRL